MSSRMTKSWIVFFRFDIADGVAELRGGEGFVIFIGSPPFSSFSVPGGVVAKHRDGSDIHVDVQMRVVISESRDEEAIMTDDDDDSEVADSTEVVYALWITYSRHLHIAAAATDPLAPELQRPITPPKRPSPGQPCTPVVGGESNTDIEVLTKQLEAIQHSPTPPSSERGVRVPPFRQPD